MPTLTTNSDALRPAMPTEETNFKYLLESQSIWGTSEDQPKLHAAIKFHVFKISAKTEN